MPDTLQERFLNFHRENPDVYAVLEEAVRRHIKRLGYTRTSVDLLVHVARWERIASTSTSLTGFKIANAHTPFYARLLIKNHPEWKPLFQLCKSAADKGDWLERVTNV